MSISNFFLFKPFARRLSLFLLTTVVVIYAAIHLNPATQRSTVAIAATFPDPVKDVALAASPQPQTAVFAGGCFWGMEGVFEHLKGVSKVYTGYAGGTAASAHYQDVSAGVTTHAESVQITYDPAQITYGQLLKVYFAIAHDPTQLNRQGSDVGSQYRSAIFFTNNEQKQVAQAYIDQLNQAKVFGRAIVTQLSPLDRFYAAEDYHQDFIKRNPYNPYVVIHDLPKIEQLREQFPDLYQDQS